jgi:hypothetical protein
MKTITAGTNSTNDENKKISEPAMIYIHVNSVLWRVQTFPVGKNFSISVWGRYLPVLFV